VAVSWHLNGAFAHDPDPERASRVDVRFTPGEDGTTTVELIHSELDRHGETWPDLRTGISGEGGWSGIIASYAEVASARTPEAGREPVT
jgi:hypothetical protein